MCRPGCSSHCSVVPMQHLPNPNPAPAHTHAHGRVREVGVGWDGAGGCTHNLAALPCGQPLAWMMSSSSWKDSRTRPTVLPHPARKPSSSMPCTAVMGSCMAEGGRRGVGVGVEGEMGGGGLSERQSQPARTNG